MAFGLSENLFKRVVSALALLPVVLGLVYMGGWWFFVLLAIGGALMIAEWCDLTGVTSKKSQYIATALVLALTGMMTFLGPEKSSAATVAIMLFVLSAPMFSQSPAKLAKRAAAETASANAQVGAAYVGLALLSLTWLRAQDDNGLIVVWTFFAVWAMDVGGYFAGKGIGGPKLAPKLSPKKTWAGLIGGMVLAAVVSLAISLWFGLGDPLLMPFAGAMVAVVAQLGDLYESAVKRAMNKKDSGSLIPGHGGILDRVDGLIFAAPVIAFAIAVPELGMTNG